MEIVLGIDNVLLVAILSQKVQPAHRARVRKLGIGLALVLRIALLFALSWLMGLTKPLFTVLGNAFSGRDLVLLVGGLFLIYKATHELYERIELSPDDEDASDAERKPAGSAATAFQILALDMVFSLDSVITAFGMASSFVSVAAAVGVARAVVVMMAAMIIAAAVMFAFLGGVSEFVNRLPSMKILALASLLLLGVLLTAAAFGHHINRGYVYFAM